MDLKKKEDIDINQYIEKLRRAPNKSKFEKLLLQISDEFDRGDFSSLDPNFPCKDFIKAMERDEKRIKEWDKSKKKNKKRSQKSQKPAPQSKILIF